MSGERGGTTAWVADVSRVAGRATGQRTVILSGSRLGPRVLAWRVVKEARMMMHMPWVLVTLMVFLVLVVSGSLVAVRVLAWRQVNHDHPQ